MRARVPEDIVREELGSIIEKTSPSSAKSIVVGALLALGCASAGYFYARETITRASTPYITTTTQDQGICAVTRMFDYDARARQYSNGKDVLLCAQVRR